MLEGDTLLCDTKETSWANPSNKKRFINKLSNTLKENGFETLYAADDVYCLNVKTARSLEKEKVTAVVGEDTDLLVLLLYHVQPERCNAFFASSTKNAAKIWDIKAVMPTLGVDICDNILFGHAIGGCDTTSSLFLIGKDLPLKKLKESPLFRNHAKAYATKSISQAKVLEAEEKALVLLYGGKIDDCLNTLRHVE